jgi:hypothetical protein
MLILLLDLQLNSLLLYLLHLRLVNLLSLLDGRDLFLLLAKLAMYNLLLWVAAPIVKLASPLVLLSNLVRHLLRLASLIVGAPASIGICQWRVRAIIGHPLRMLLVRHERIPISLHGVILISVG